MTSRAWMMKRLRNPFAIMLVVTLLFTCCQWALAWRVTNWGNFGRLFMFLRADYEYAPLIRHFFDVRGEPQVWETATRTMGPILFPYFALLPFAILTKLFGAFGLVIAEVLCGAFRMFAMTRFFRVFVRRAPIAVMGAFLFEMLFFEHVFTALNSVAPFINRSILRGHGFFQTIAAVDFAPFVRVPRPLFTLPLLLLTLTLLARIWKTRAVTRNEALKLGMLGAAVASSNVHLITIVAVLAGVIFWSICSDARAGVAERFVKRIVWALPVFVVLCVPYLAQAILFKRPELELRLFAFPLGYGRVTIAHPTAYLLVFLTGLQALVLAPWARRPRWLTRLARTGIVTFCFLLTGAPVLAMPLMSLLLHQTIHESAYLEVMLQIDVIVILALITCALNLAFSAVRDRFRRRNAIPALSAACLLVGMVSALMAMRYNPRLAPKNRHPRLDIPGYSLASPKFRDDFIAVTDLLARTPGYETVLTFDLIVTNYEVGFRGKHAYIPPAYFTKLSDAELEDRFLSAAKLLGVKEADLEAVLEYPPETPYIQVWSFSGGKYALGRPYSLAPLSEYPPAVLDHLPKTEYSPWTTWWIPRNKMAALREAYHKLDAESWKRYRLDAIVLLNTSIEEKFVPDTRYFRLALRNDALRVYLPIK